MSKLLHWSVGFIIFLSTPNIFASSLTVINKTNNKVSLLWAKVGHYPDYLYPVSNPKPIPQWQEYVIEPDQKVVFTGLPNSSLWVRVGFLDGDKYFFLGQNVNASEIEIPAHKSKENWKVTLEKK